MRLIHLSDLHLGKRINEFSMIEDQEYILTKIINIIDEKEVEGVMIAGDIYDKAVPPAEAIQLFDDFITRLSHRNIPVFIISGNHDSAERMAFGSRLLDSKGIFLSPVFSGRVESIRMVDSFGELNFYLLPFIKPAYIRKIYPDENVESYNDAVKVAVKKMEVDENKRNVLIAHQFVTGATRCESEDISVGGIDNVEATIFKSFDYAALGHIHSPQDMGINVRYCGTPLKYSFSEVNHKKSATIVEIGGKGDLSYFTVDLIPKRDMRKIKGSYMEVTSRENYINTNVEDYIHITLTDDDDIQDAIGKLRSIYPNIMSIEYDNKRTRENKQIDGTENIEKKTPLDMLKELYELQNNTPMTKEQENLASDMIEKVWEVER
ncbi:exonuclease SbcCD subunit D [Alkalibacter mobilis]|uniref:exonuclease SbcCD subunit D n=1 Tax=Alkalibacter mobilis TaxID=2787712 RepID=UPI0018A096C5|nr:exonuclease SbcCD subunit D [Alkalibacter mobilis]MBF7096773.1 exonuclease SbcCD subunit D [Alkalibacter mobilis]